MSDLPASVQQEEFDLWGVLKSKADSEMGVRIGKTREFLSEHCIQCPTDWELPSVATMDEEASFKHGVIILTEPELSAFKDTGMNEDVLFQTTDFIPVFTLKEKKHFKLATFVLDPRFVPQAIPGPVFAPLTAEKKEVIQDAIYSFVGAATSVKRVYSEVETLFYDRHLPGWKYMNAFAQILNNCVIGNVLFTNIRYTSDKAGGKEGTSIDMVKVVYAHDSQQGV